MTKTLIIATLLIGVSASPSFAWLPGDRTIEQLDRDMRQDEMEYLAREQADDAREARDIAEYTREMVEEQQRHNDVMESLRSK
jgi:hypothetical protein